MITAGEPQEFIPLGREFLKIHPRDVSLPTENVPPAFSSREREFDKDLLKAFLGVSIKDNVKEKWFLKEGADENLEEEFYWKDETVVWSRGSGHGSGKIYKSFTMNTTVKQVLWCEFRVQSCKPRISNSVEIDDPIGISGVGIVEDSAITVFSTTGEDLICYIPFQIRNAWSSKFGVILERDTVSELQNDTKSSTHDNLPVIFSMIHPLDDISPVIRKKTSTSKPINYICDPSEEIIFCSIDPSLVVSYNSKNGNHSVWKLRATTFNEAEYACSKIQLEVLNQSVHTPVTKVSSLKHTHSKLNISHRTPTSNVNSPYHSHTSSRVASPSLHQVHSSTPSSTGLTHMATLSRSQPPSHNSANVSHPQNFTPMSALTHRSPISQQDAAKSFMEPLAPDICFEHEWSSAASFGHSEKASKVFLSTDVTGQNYLCLLVKEQSILYMVKFENMNSSSKMVFGSSSVMLALDADSLSSLNLMMIVEKNGTMSLYTGFTMVSKVHVSERPFNLNRDSSMSHEAFFTPKRTSFVTSTRPPSAAGTRFGEESTPLSPVPMESDENSSFLKEDISFCSVGNAKCIRDCIHNRITLETECGYYRLEIPSTGISATVKKCLDALKCTLSKEVYTNLYVKWYTTLNSPGLENLNSETELNVFLKCLLGQLGFDTDNILLGHIIKNNCHMPVQTKRQKTHEKGCDDDWHNLFSTNPDKLNVECRSFKDVKPTVIDETAIAFNDSAALFPYMAHVFYTVHLVYEDCKLDVTLTKDLMQLCSFLCEVGRELRQFDYLDLYFVDYPIQFTQVREHFMLSEDKLANIQIPPYFSEPPSIYRQLEHLMCFSSAKPFPYIPKVTKKIFNIVLVYGVLSSMEMPVLQITDYLSSIAVPGSRVEEEITNEVLSSCYAVCTDSKMAAICLMNKLGFTSEDINLLPLAVTIPIRDGLYNCRQCPSGLWSTEMFDLIGRHDLASLELSGRKKVNVDNPKIKLDIGRNALNKDNDDGLEHLDLEVLNLRFCDDHRIHDVYHMLQSSKPSKIALIQRPEVSDHEFIEEQERHLLNLCIRHMAATIGRGMFTLRCYNPVVTETLPIPKLCLCGKALPRNTSVELSHIETPANLTMWPLFHNGVAAGLSISPNASKITSTWIVYNKPKNFIHDSLYEHAGFLMGLGLNGHLSRLSTLSIHDYLCKANELTSVGVLLGYCAAKRGTMDLSCTKLLSIHIEALLPPTSTELDVASSVQVAAVMGLGLLYQGSGHHHMSEVLLGEIGRPPGPEMDHSTDRESYSLAAGLALGLVTFGKGKEMSRVADRPMADHLFHFMVGGHKRPLFGTNKEKFKSPSYQIREGDNVNVDVTSSGSTLALGMMFFDTNNQAIADWMKAPDTQFLLDQVRPDFLLLRTLSRGLILWSSVHPSREWVESHVPEVIKDCALSSNNKGFLKAPDIDYETMGQCYVNILAGGCFCIGLKFAGSGNSEAYDILMHYSKLMQKWTKKFPGDYASKSTIETCLNIVVLSVAMVMAGTGDLNVIRLCRYLRSRVNQVNNFVLYGSHIATHMALGLLFLGGGKYTLSTSPLAVGAMICSFFPRFPVSTSDNRYHLQAFHHLYVLAVEPRLIIPRLIDSNKPVHINVHIKFKDTPYYSGESFEAKAPCMLPELKLLEKVTIGDERYWTIVFKHDENWNVLTKLLQNGGSLYVVQNSGSLPYTKDPTGDESFIAQSNIYKTLSYKTAREKFLGPFLRSFKFSSNTMATNFAQCFLLTSNKHELEKAWQHDMCNILFTYCDREKLDALPLVISMFQIVRDHGLNAHTIQVNNIKMLSAYTCWQHRYSCRDIYTKKLLNTQKLLPIISVMEGLIASFVKNEKQSFLHYLTRDPSRSDCIPKYHYDIASFILLFDVISLKPFKESDILTLGQMPVLHQHAKNYKLLPGSILHLHEALTACLENM